MSKLDFYDLHVHLYGCITPEMLFELGKDRYPKLRERLEWYANEYQLASGYRPKPDLYWEKSAGLELLRRDYLMLEPARFSVFQAKFNLAIALFPVADPHDQEIARAIFTEHQNLGISGAEYRMTFPRSLPAASRVAWLAALCRTAMQVHVEHPEFEPRIALSLSREDEQLREQLQHLEDFLHTASPECRYLSAVDFCAAEEAFPPCEKEWFFRYWRQKKSSDPKYGKLQLVYHVGETFTTLSLMSSARWVYQANAYGCDRLGHALSLGIDPEMLVNDSVMERVGERLQHIDFLLSEKSWLTEFGYPVDERLLKRERGKLQAMPMDTRIPIKYTRAYREEARVFQNSLLRRLSALGVVIESCPTSNQMLGCFTQPERHPLKRFLDAGCRVVLGSDDPGIFACSLPCEHHRVEKVFSLETHELLCKYADEQWHLYSN